MVHDFLRVFRFSLSLLLITLGHGYSQTRSFIYTERTSPVGLITYPSTAVITKNAVDGYVRVSGSTKFIFPVADNGVYRPFAASANGTSGAYFLANPSVAITSKPKGGNYGPLPVPGPFSVLSKHTNVGSVSTKEYWDINGVNPTKITLTWDAASGIANLLNNRALSNLFIVGWNGAKWMKIESAIDATSVFGGESTLTSGSLTTTTAFVPNAYSVYTLAATLVSAPPALQQNLIVTADNQRVNMAWDKENDDEVEFEVEKKENGDNWKPLQRIGSRDGSSRRYTTQDLNPAQGENSYRLKVIRSDGSHSYSKLSTLYFKPQVEAEAEVETSIYPNPARDRFFLQSGNIEEIQQVMIYDLSGKRVLSSSSFSEGVDVTSLNLGTYVVSIKDSKGKITSKKLVVGK